MRCPGMLGRKVRISSKGMGEIVGDYFVESTKALYFYVLVNEKYLFCIRDYELGNVAIITGKGAKKKIS
jgi:hypothetical protein